MPTEPIELFEPERQRLTGLAYRMLGRLEDAEDVVQEAWIRFSNQDDVASIDSPAAWLTTVTTRLALDRLRSAASRRERYVGPWLADPLLETASIDSPPDESAILAESLSIGFIAVMERLSPLERAVFLLHEVFAYPLTEVAAIVERSHDATRKLASRARKHVTQERPRFEPEPEHIEILAAQVMAAATSGDIETLSSFLAEDIVHISDGGPNHRAARAPIVGQHRVSRFFIGLAKRFVPGMAFHQVRANGQPALYLTVDDKPYMLHVANWSNGKMVGSFAVLNPDKLSAFHQAWSAQQREPDK